MNGEEESLAVMRRNIDVLCLQSKTPSVILPPSPYHTTSHNPSSVAVSGSQLVLFWTWPSLSPGRLFGFYASLWVGWRHASISQLHPADDAHGLRKCGISKSSE